MSGERSRISLKLLWPVAFMLSWAIEPSIRTRRDIARTVVLATVSCVVATLAIECLVQWLSWVDATTAIRGFIIAFVESAAISAVAAFFVSRSQLALYEAKLAAEHASLVDPLTGLMNRRAMNALVESTNGGTLALLIADIDHFKRINDTYGHLAGDQVIAAVGMALAEALAAFGPLARVGGEEFALIASEASGESILAQMDAARRRIAETPIVVGGRALRVTVSAGLATAGPDHDFDALYTEADRALYLAKTTGRDRVLRFPDSGLDPEKLCA
jgi:diguanylate cyclase (GGDEF)-like protein